MAAELVVTGGTVLTQDPAHPVAEGVAVLKGRIKAVGTAAEMERLAGPGTRRVHLDGATLVPGLIDAHAHLWKMGHLLTTMADLRGVGSLGELAERLRTAAARRPDGWLLARGYNEGRLAEHRPPLRADLDLISADRPIVLTRTCGHIYACNSAALRAAGITRDTPDPAGGVVDRDPAGEPTGLLHETAMGLVLRRMPPPTPADLAAMVVAALRHQLPLGITSSNDAGVAPALLDVYRRLDQDQALPSRANVMALRLVDGIGEVPLPEPSVSEHLRIDTVKFLADGGLSGATAALSVRYRHADTRGVLRFTDPELDRLAGAAHRAGLRIAIHAIGDVTIDQVLALYQRLGPGPKRHRIEHFGLPDAAQLARAAALRVIAVPQTIFLPELGRNFREYLPDGWLSRAYPVRAMLDAGITVALSSDAPVVESDDPMRGIQAAVDRRDADGSPIAAEQAITAAEALYGYTMGGAIASGDDFNRGSITPGKFADFAVLDGNPLTTATEELGSIRVRATWLGGRLVYERTAA